MRFPKNEIRRARALAEASIGGKLGYCQPIRKRDLLINALGILMPRSDPGYFRPSPLDTHAYTPIWARMLLIKVLEESHLAEVAERARRAI